MKLSAEEFANMIGITRTSLYYKETNQTDWTLNEIIKVYEIMKQNGIDEQLTVSVNGTQYNFAITKIIA